MNWKTVLSGVKSKFSEWLIAQSWSHTTCTLTVSRKKVVQSLCPLCQQGHLSWKSQQETLRPSSSLGWLMISWFMYYKSLFGPGLVGSKVGGGVCACLPPCQSPASQVGSLAFRVMYHMGCEHFQLVRMMLFQRSGYSLCLSESAKNSCRQWKPIRLQRLRASKVK